MSIKIGQLAKQTKCKVVTIRYYEKQGLMPEPSRSVGNFRLYDDAHIKRLHFIRYCRALGMKLDDIRRLFTLRDGPTQDCDGVVALLNEHIQQVECRIATLLELKHSLTELRNKCSGGQPIELCGILKGLSDCVCDHASSTVGAEFCFAVDPVGAFAGNRPLGETIL